MNSAPANCIPRHCDFLGENKLDFLVRSSKEDIMTFLKWMLDVYPGIRKQSTLHEYWRVWCMLYRKSVGHSVHAKVMEEVNDVRARRDYRMVMLNRASTLSTLHGSTASTKLLEKSR
jgi:hypothetical protein